MNPGVGRQISIVNVVIVHVHVHACAIITFVCI